MPNFIPNFPVKGHLGNRITTFHSQNPEIPAFLYPDRQRRGILGMESPHLIPRILKSRHFYSQTACEGAPWEWNRLQQVHRTPSLTSMPVGDLTPRRCAERLVGPLPEPQRFSAWRFTARVRIPRIPMAPRGISRPATRSAVLRLPFRSAWTAPYRTLHRTVRIHGRARSGSNPQILCAMKNEIPKGISFFMVRQGGFEPPASTFGVCHSIP